MDELIEKFLTAWYPGEWPDALDLPGGESANEAFRRRAREECRAAFIAAGINKLLEASCGTK